MCVIVTGQINPVNPSYLKKSVVSTLAQILCLRSGKFCLRSRENWSVRVQISNAGVTPKSKRTYDWEDVPLGIDRDEPEVKPDTLNEACHSFPPLSHCRVRIFEMFGFHLRHLDRCVHINARSPRNSFETNLTAVFLLCVF